MFELLYAAVYGVLFLCWGSFLNVLAYRLIHGNLGAVRSFCPSCKRVLAWYDIVPLISYFVLRGICRTCRKPISLLYPFIELLTVILFLLLMWCIEVRYILGSGIFFSALIITVRTDLETMLISRWVTLFLVPLGFLLSASGLLPITVTNSVIGAASAGVFLFLVATVFTLITKKEGMGQGDIDLLMFIGSFLGPVGWWVSLLLGSLLGSFVGIGIFLLQGNHWSRKIPFGPFLALGAIIDVFLHQSIIEFLFCR